MNSFAITIFCPKGELYRGKAKSIKLTTIDGPMEILPLHAPIVCQLSGRQVNIESISVGNDNKDVNLLSFPLESGYLKFVNNNCLVLVR